MSPFQLYIAIDREIKKYDLPKHVTTSDITYWINKSINEYVDEKMLNIDKTEEIRQSLKGLINSGTITAGTTTSIDSTSNKTPYALPDQDTRLFLSEKVSINYGSITKTESVLPVTFDQLNIKLNDPFSMHFERMNTSRPLRYIEGSDVILVTDAGVTVGTYSYIRLLNPTPFTVSSASDTSEYTELPAKAHQEIISKTVRMVIDNINPERYSEYSVEEIKSKQ